MNQNEIINEVAKLDGMDLLNEQQIEEKLKKDQRIWQYEIPNYLESREAVILVIEKQSDEIREYIWFLISNDYMRILVSPKDTIRVEHIASIIRKCTALSLCIALLKATHKWKD